MSNKITYVFLFLVASILLTNMLNDNDTFTNIMKVLCGLTMLISIVGYFRHGKKE